MKTVKNKIILACVLALILIAGTIVATGIIRNNNSNNGKLYSLEQSMQHDLLRMLDAMNEMPEKYSALSYFTETECKDDYCKFEKYIRTSDYYGLLTVIVYRHSQRDESAYNLNRNFKYLNYKTTDETNPNAWSFQYYDGQSYVNIDLWSKNEEINAAQGVLEELIAVMTAV